MWKTLFFFNILERLFGLLKFHLCSINLIIPIFLLLSPCLHTAVHLSLPFPVPTNCPPLSQTPFIDLTIILNLKRRPNAPVNSVSSFHVPRQPHKPCCTWSEQLNTPLNTSHLSPRLHLQGNKVHSPAGDAVILGVGWLSCLGGGSVVSQHRWQSCGSSSERLVGWRWCRLKMSSACPCSPALNSRSFFGWFGVAHSDSGVSTSSFVNLCCWNSCVCGCTHLRVWRQLKWLWVSQIWNCNCCRINL